MSATLALAGGIVIPVAGALGIVACHRAPNLRETVTLVTAVLLFATVASLLPGVLAGDRPELSIVEILPGLALSFRLEPLGMLFALIASGLWIINSIYSIGYLRGNDEKHQTRFYVCFALAIAAAMGIAFAGNAFTLFVFYEMLTLVTYPLVTHHGTDHAKRGARVYLGVLLSTSILFLLPAIVFTWYLAGTTEFTPGGILPEGAGSLALGGLLALYMFGIGKAALMPFHRWLPSAMVAPTPVSALLHAVAVVKAGVFSVVKVMIYVFGVDQLQLAGTDWLVAVSGFTIVAASITALNADNLKRRLAYSTVSQLSYVVLAAALLAPLSMVAAILHIAAHALGKITLFFAAGSIYTAAHKTEVSQLDGIGRRMPWTMAAFAIGALSMIGLPPAAGFVSKWFLVSGAIAQAHWMALTVIAASTLLNAAYFMPIIYRAFFRPLSANDEAHPHGESPLPMVVALTLTALGTIALFFFPDVPLALAGAALGGI
ncbi:MAG TPA: proton-conducting transporter membrane subunit [Rhodocyclaceae bacterium]